MNDLENLRKENEELKEKIRVLEKKINSQKEGMESKAKEGKIVSRAAFGYKIENGILVPAENSGVVENLFLDFKNNNLSLNKFAIKYGFTINGLKKILTNFTYIGKIKFNGELHEGNHKPLITPMLFNQVQDKLERKGIKKVT